MKHQTGVAFPDSASVLSAGRDVHALITELFPICRSLTGDGVRATLARLRELVPLDIVTVPSGTAVLDWHVPKEWNIRDAWIKDSGGRKVVDFAASNLHVLSYSAPVHARLTLDALRPHLHSIPEHPDWIPYLTSYYNESWGFCLPHRVLEALPDGEYEVCIDSTLADGELLWGEWLLRGDTDDEVLLSTYLCHPSMANDNLSGTALLAHLAARMQGRRFRYTYRFLFIPETIGSIAWLARHQADLGRIRHGLVATCLGDRGDSTYKRCRTPSTIDRVVEVVLRDSGTPFRMIDFFPWGSDERQFCSPGFDLPVGSLMRTPYAEFAEYHTSADNLDFVTSDALGDTLAKYAAVIDTLELDGVYRNLQPFGEPQLGRRGLYQRLGAQRAQKEEKLAIFWVLNLSDGKHSLVEIAHRSGLPFRAVRAAAEALHAVNLLGPVDVS